MSVVIVVQRGLVLGLGAGGEDEFGPTIWVCEARGEDVWVRGVGWTESDEARSVGVVEEAKVAQSDAVDQVSVCC